MDNDDKWVMLRHFLATLAYRTQKAVRGAPGDFAEFEAGNLSRTPQSDSMACWKISPNTCRSPTLSLTT